MSDVSSHATPLSETADDDEPAEDAVVDPDHAASSRMERLKGASPLLKMQRSLDRFADPLASLGVGRFSTMASLRAVDMFDRLGVGRHAAALGSSSIANALTAVSVHSSVAAHLDAFDTAKLLGFDHSALTAAALGPSRTDRAWEAMSVHRSLAANFGMVDSSKLLGFQQAALAFGAGNDHWRGMERLAQSFGLSSALGDHIDRLGRADRSFRHLLPKSTHSAWGEHLRSALLPALSFLAHDWNRPIGLLMELPRAGLGASISWPTTRRGDARVSTAAVSTGVSDDAAGEVIVECDPVCSICGGPLLSLGSDLSWLGPKLGLRRRRIFPACADCTRREPEEPGFLQRSLPPANGQALGVRLELIKGQGKGDGRPIARLRIVRWED